MEYTKDKNKPGILFFIDFEKAFDSLEWDFLNKCLELFNFGPELIRWVNIFYKNIQSCVINNGLCCDYFNIERGVRQGDPLSPYLFVTAVEILAIAIRNNDSIKGIEINDLETKLLQFADDTTAVLSDLNSANVLFSLLKEFEKASGLKLNVKKTEAMWIGSLRSCEDQPLGVKWQTCVKFLGIHITYDIKLSVEKNFKQRLKKIKNVINLWKVRGLSIHGKVTIIKAFLLSKMIYPSSVLTTPPEIIKEFNTLVFHFLWNGKDKVTRRSAYAPYHSGGINMVDYENMVKALRLSWLKRIIDDSCSSFWKLYLNDLLSSHGGLFLFNCNYAVDKLNISDFYYELLLWWSELRDLVDCDGEYRYIIWNNREVKIDGKSVFYKRYLLQGIKYTEDLLYDKTNIDSFNISEGEKSLNSNFLTWTGLRHAVPLNLRVIYLSLFILFLDGCYANILTNISNCGCLLLSDVIIGILKEGMDLVNYVIILGKSYLWSCRHKQIKPSISHFERILEKKYETEKYIAFKSNRTISFRDKWKSYEELLLSG